MVRGVPVGSLTVTPPVSPGSPLQFYVDAINPRHVSAYGPGLSHGMVNKPCTFTIVTKDAGEGEWWPTVTMETPSNATGRGWEGVGDPQCLLTPTPCPSGGLSLAVEGPSKAEITCQDNKDGTCTVSYLPTAPGDYNIIVRFDDKHIPGSPFTAKITGEKGPPWSWGSHQDSWDLHMAMGTPAWSRP